MKRLVTIVFMLSAAACFAQKQYNLWYFGNKAALDFNSGSPVAVSGSAMLAAEGSSSISDSTTGNLLFYTNGRSVWNRNNVIMPDGSGLDANSSSTQAALIIPAVNTPDRYYIFTTGASSGNGFKYSEVDMTLNGGLGNVINSTKNTSLQPATSERLAATWSDNCSDIWVVSHDQGSNTFNAHKVTSAGVSNSPVTSSVGMTPTVSWGSMKMSHNGEKIVLLSYNGTGNNAQIFDFNRVSGLVTNPQTISNNLKNPYSAEFSPNDSVLYIGYLFGIKHFETYNANVSSTETLTSAVSSIATLKMGPDQKIYCCTAYANTSLSVINNPNNKTNPNFVLNAIPLAGGTSCTNGLPVLMSAGCSINSLPIKLLDFTALLNHETVELQWQTASESNNDYFTIERSGDGENWTVLSIVSGSGNSTQTMRYSFVDNQPLTGQNYYRLKQTDYNGEYTYSKIVVIENNSARSFIIYPNPTEGKFRVESLKLEVGPSLHGRVNEVQVFDLLGNLVLATPKREIDLSDYRPGVYLIKVGEFATKLILTQ